VPRFNPGQRRRAQRFAQAKGITCQRAAPPACSAVAPCAHTSAASASTSGARTRWPTHWATARAPPFNISPEEGRSIGL
jgi:hypothetical protein